MRFQQYQPQPYVSSFVPMNLDLVSKFYGEKQQRADTANQTFAKTTADMMNDETLDPQTKQQVMDKWKEAHDNMLMGINGNVADHSDRMFNLLSQARSDPYWNLEKQKMEAYKQEQSIRANLTANGRLLEFESVADKPIIQNGRYVDSTSFKSDLEGLLPWQDEMTKTAAQHLVQKNTGLSISTFSKDHPELLRERYWKGISQDQVNAKEADIWNAYKKTDAYRQQFKAYTRLGEFTEGEPLTPDGAEMRIRAELDSSINNKVDYSPVDNAITNSLYGKDIPDRNPSVGITKANGKMIYKREYKKVEDVLDAWHTNTKKYKEGVDKLIKDLNYGNINKLKYSYLGADGKPVADIPYIDLPVRDRPQWQAYQLAVKNTRDKFVNAVTNGDETTRRQLLDNAPVNMKNTLESALTQRIYDIASYQSQADNVKNFFDTYIYNAPGKKRGMKVDDFLGTYHFAKEANQDVNSTQTVKEQVTGPDGTTQWVDKQVLNTPLSQMLEVLNSEYTPNNQPIMVGTNSEITVPVLDSKGNFSAAGAAAFDKAVREVLNPSTVFGSDSFNVRDITYTDKSGETHTFVNPVDPNATAYGLTSAKNLKTLDGKPFAGQFTNFTITGIGMTTEPADKDSRGESSYDIMVDVMFKNGDTEVPGTIRVPLNEMEKFSNVNLSGRLKASPAFRVADEYSKGLALGHHTINPMLVAGVRQHIAKSAFDQGYERDAEILSRMVRADVYYNNEDRAQDNVKITTSDGAIYNMNGGDFRKLSTEALNERVRAEKDAAIKSTGHYIPSTVQ